MSVMRHTLGPNYIARAREALDFFGNEAVGVYPEHGKEFSAGSPAACELSASRDPHMPVDALTMATALIGSGSEHVLAYSRAITEPILTTACWSCARSVLEPCAFALWLLNPQIDPHTRGGRVYALRYKNMEEGLKYIRAVSGTDTDIQKQKSRIREVEREAFNYGYLPLTARSRAGKRKGKRIGIGQVMPSATEVIKQMLDEEGTYRVLSAAAHARSWAIRVLGKRETGHRRKIENTQVVIFEAHTKPETIAAFSVASAKALAKSLWEQHCYAGWEKKHLIEVFEQTYNRLGIKEIRRFWRQPS